jgi:hypothetical protein
MGNPNNVTALPSAGESVEATNLRPQGQTTKLSGLDKGLLIGGAVTSAAGVGLAIWNRLVIGDVRHKVDDLDDLAEDILCETAALRGHVEAMPDLVTERVLLLTQEFTRLGSSNDGLTTLQKAHDRLEAHLNLLGQQESDDAKKALLANIHQEVATQGEHLRAHAESVGLGQSNLAKAFQSATETAKQVERLESAVDRRNDRRDEDRDEGRRKSRKKSRKKRSRR